MSEYEAVIFHLGELVVYIFWYNFLLIFFCGGGVGGGTMDIPVCVRKGKRI